MTSIIFGINGQDGFYLSEFLQSRNHNVVGIARNNTLNVSLINFESLVSLFDTYKPDFIFHLAANSTTKHEALFENQLTINTGTLNILEAVRVVALNCKVFISGSGLQFKNNNEAIKETDPFDPKDAYSVSRIQSVYASRYFRNKFGINVYVGYLFNHDSPKRPMRHLAQETAIKIIEIAEDKRKTLEVGNLSLIKEWAFAGDIVEGIFKLVNQNKIFEANISSGVGYSIQDWLEVCFKLIGKKWQDYVIENKSYENTYYKLISDPTLINSLGWYPKVGLENLAEMMLTNVKNHTK